MDAEPGAAPPAAGPREPRALAWTLCALLASAAFAAAGPAYLATHDGPQHVFALHVAGQLDAPGRGWNEWLEPTLPVTSLGFAAVYAPLDLWLPWPLAQRAALALLALAWIGGSFALASALHPRRAWLGIALGAAAFSWSFAMGFFAFHAATSAGLALLAWAFARPRESTRELALLAFGLFALAVMHVVAAFLCGLVLAALLWFRAAPGGKPAALLRIAALALPAAMVALALLSVGSGALIEWNGGGEGGGWNPAPWWMLGKGFVGGPAWRAWPLTLLAGSALALAASGRLAPLRAEERALLASGGVALAAAALLPRDLPMWDFFSPRFLPVGVTMLVLALPFERVVRGRALAAGALASFALAATFWAGQHHFALERATREARSGLDAPIERRGMRLPIVLDAATTPDISSPRAPMPYAMPLVNLAQLYAASQGGVTPYGFTVNPRIHGLLLRERGEAQRQRAPNRGYLVDLAKPAIGGDPGFRLALLSYLASRAPDFEDVIFYGRSEEADFLRTLGFTEDWRHHGLSIARFRGCPRTLHFSPGAAAAAGRFELGWYPSWHASRRYELARGDADQDGSRRLRLRESCGELWLRFLDVAIACEGSDEQGRLQVGPASAEPSLYCRLPGENWSAGVEISAH